MTIHPTVGAFMLAGAMTDMVRGAATWAADRADQANLDAWAVELTLARDDAAAVQQVAVGAVKRLALLTAEVEDLEAENARLRAALAQRNATIRRLSRQ
jgi:hypothetical protein